MKLNSYFFSIFFLTSFVLNGFSLAFGQRLLLNEDKKYPIEKQYLKFLKDPNNQLSIIDVLKKSADFQDATSAPLNFGLSKSTYWLQINLQNFVGISDNMKWALVIQNPFLKQASVHLKQGERLWSSVDLIKFYGLEHHLPSYRFPTVILDIELAEETTIYIQLQSHLEAYYPIYLIPHHQLMDVSRTENTSFGITIGAIFIVVVSSLFLFFSTKKSIFLYMILYSLLSPTVTHIQVGYVQFFLPDSWYGKSDVLFTFIVSVAMSSVYLFAMVFIGLPERYPKLTFLFKGCLIFSLVCSFIAFVDVQVSMIVTTVSAIIMVTNLTIACVHVYRSKAPNRKEAICYLIAWCPVVIAILAKTIVLAGVPVPKMIVDHSMSVGILVHVYLVMLLLLMCVRAIEQDRLRANAELATLLDAFKVFVPAKILDTAEHSSTSININQSYEEFITLFFADMRGFTKISESMSPGSLMKFLNLYFERFHRVTAKHGGVIDKYIGDAAMVIYSLHNARPAESASAALASAVGLQDKLQRYSAKWGSKHLIPQMGIGIHSGQVTMGTVGSTNRKDFTVIGDAVNVAARLESLTKYYGIKLLLTETTYQLLNDKNYIRFVDHIAVYGKTEPTKIYQRLIHQEIDEFEKIQMFYQEAIDAYYQQNFKEALDSFQNMQQLSPNDQVLNVFIQRCQHFLQSPPEADWDGVFYLDTK